MQIPVTIFRYYGLSPFEIEAIYSTLQGPFWVNDLPSVENDIKFVSMIDIEFKVVFSESFFELFSMDRWFRMKAIFKEIKRRRGKKGVKIVLRFRGIAPSFNQNLIFSLFNKEDRKFEIGLEKIEYLVDVIPHQISSLPAEIRDIYYGFDSSISKWNPVLAIGSDKSNYYFKEGKWNT